LHYNPNFDIYYAVIAGMPFSPWKLLLLQERPCIKPMLGLISAGCGGMRIRGNWKEMDLPHFGLWNSNIDANGYASEYRQQCFHMTKSAGCAVVRRLRL
jgi:hypothetical protein